MVVLPDDGINYIYFLSHNMAYIDVMNELKEKRLQCRVNITLDMAYRMIYI
jgi:hypothetical protein